MFAAGGGRIDRGFTGRRHGNDDAVAAVPGALTAFQATVAAASQALTVAAAPQTLTVAAAPQMPLTVAAAPQALTVAAALQTPLTVTAPLQRGVLGEGTSAGGHPVRAPSEGTE